MFVANSQLTEIREKSLRDHCCS